jgi:hypothetical protein
MTSCSILAPPAATAPMTSPATAIGKPPGTLVKSPMRTAMLSIRLGRIAGRLALGGGGDGLALCGDDREMARLVHSQKGDEPAALVARLTLQPSASPLATPAWSIGSPHG